MTAPLSFPSLAEPGRSIVRGRDPVPRPGNGPGIERLVPQKVGPEQEPISLRLTRRQRLVYFLVDGQRTVADLARTTSKTVLEIGIILDELHEQNLVTI